MPDDNSALGSTVKMKYKLFGKEPPVCISFIKSVLNVPGSSIFSNRIKLLYNFSLNIKPSTLNKLIYLGSFAETFILHTVVVLLLDHVSFNWKYPASGFDESASKSEY